MTRKVHRYDNGSVERYVDYEYDAKGNKTRSVSRNSDGSVNCYVDYEYDAGTGKKVSKTFYNYENGELTGSTKFEYDENGDVVKKTKYDKDGNEIE